MRRECPSGAVHHGIVCDIECKAQKMCHVAVRQLPVVIVQGEGISDEVVNGKMVRHKRIRMSRLFSVFGAWTGGRGQGAFSTTLYFYTKYFLFISIFLYPLLRK